MSATLAESVAWDRASPAEKAAAVGIPLVCPSCDGSGAGNGFGVSGAGGMCRDCLGVGAVSPTKRARLIARGASSPKAP